MLLGGNIEIISISPAPSSVVAIDKASSGLITGGELIQISGRYPTDITFRGEQILVIYIDQNSDKKELLIECSGGSPAMGETEHATLVISFFIGALVFLAFGTISLFYGRKKRKEKIKLVGFLLLFLSASVFAAFILLLLSNP